jgi:rubrerythrin
MRVRRNMRNTIENLQAAFAGESQASRKYTYFAEKADKEGYPQIARLFRAASEAETVHARNHLNVLNGIGTTAENLKAAISGEHEEFMNMYPEFIAKARDEKNIKAESSFDKANKVEKVHHELYTAALKNVEAGKKTAERPFYVCQICGETIEGEAPDRCPICGAPKNMFKKVE